MSVEALLSFALAIFVFAITPGPGVFALLAKAMREGVWRSTPLNMGMATSDVAYLVLACYGLSTLAAHWGEVFTVVRFVGGAYLLYLALKMWTSPIHMETPVSTLQPTAVWAGFLQGFLISASNPKVILFYIAFLPTFLDVQVLTGQDVVLVALVTFSSLMLGLTLIAMIAAWMRQVFRSQKAQRRVNRSAASLMGLAGLYLVVRH